jgi:hypothetical protein
MVTRLGSDSGGNVGDTEYGGGLFDDSEVVIDADSSFLLEELFQKADLYPVLLKKKLGLDGALRWQWKSFANSRVSWILQYLHYLLWD